MINFKCDFYLNLRDTDKSVDPLMSKNETVMIRNAKNYYKVNLSYLIHIFKKKKI